MESEINYHEVIIAITAGIQKVRIHGEYFFTEPPLLGKNVSHIYTE